MKRIIVALSAAFVFCLGQTVQAQIKIKGKPIELATKLKLKLKNTETMAKITYMGYVAKDSVKNNRQVEPSGIEIFMAVTDIQENKDTLTIITLAKTQKYWPNGGIVIYADGKRVPMFDYIMN